MTASISAIRLEHGLRSALGHDLLSILDKPDVTDVLLNADGRIWVDRLRTGREYSGLTMESATAAYVLRMLASHSGRPLTESSPLLNATFPTTNERIAGTIYPITMAPTASIRKPPLETFDESAFPYKKYKDKDELQETLLMPEALDMSIRNKKNVLIAGGTGSGKTSLLSSLLKRESIKKDRCIIIEDAHEIQISAEDHVRFLTSREVSQNDLVEHSLRSRPDRLIIGEVRSGKVAVSLINGLNSGHAGSFCTIHADSARKALRRLELLCRQGCGDPQSEAIADAIGCVVYCRRGEDGRREITNVLTVHGYDESRRQFIINEAM